MLKNKLPDEMVWVNLYFVTEHENYKRYNCIISVPCKNKDSDSIAETLKEDYKSAVVEEKEVLVLVEKKKEESEFLGTPTMNN